MSTVLITGANRGIGLSLATRYAQRGDAVIAACRTSDVRGVRRRGANEAASVGASSTPVRRQPSG